MLLTTQTGYLARKFGDAESIRMLAEAGYDSYDFSCHVCPTDGPVYGDNYKEYAAEIKAVSEKYNISCTQAHSVYPSARYGEDEMNEIRFERIVRNIEFVFLIGGKTIVVHPVKDYPEECDIKQINIDFYNRLLPYCKEFNVKVCLENLFSIDYEKGITFAAYTGIAEGFKECLDALDPEWFTACVDIGHCGLVGEQPQRMIRVLGNKYVHALHVHDNDNKTDIHTIPYLSKIDWEEVCKALVDIDYNDEFTYEADGFLKAFPDELLQDGANFMCKVGRNLVKRIEELKAEKKGEENE